MNRVSKISFIGFFLLAWIFSATEAYSQSNAYAKFDRTGATVGLYNLLSDATGCEASRTFSGTITKVNYDVGDGTYSYTFTLNSAGKRLSISLVVSDDEILQPDVEDLITKNRRVRVRARQCGSGGFWTAEEIRRL